jgi:hypothetical protein
LISVPRSGHGPWIVVGKAVKDPSGPSSPPVPVTAAVGGSRSLRQGSHLRRLAGSRFVVVSPLHGPHHPRHGIDRTSAAHSSLDSPSRPNRRRSPGAPWTSSLLHHIPDPGHRGIAYPAGRLQGLPPCYPASCLQRGGGTHRIPRLDVLPPAVGAVLQHQQRRSKNCFYLSSILSVYSIDV